MFFALPQGVSAAEGDYDPECDPGSSEYVGAEDAEEYCFDDESDVAGESPEAESNSNIQPEEGTDDSGATTATTQDCTNMKECNIPETGPSEVIISLLGVMILGYGMRKWVASRHAKHAAMQGLYQNEENS